jgi:quinol monooxygenase YgiN
MSNPFILIARIRVKDGKINDYLKIANEVDNSVKNSEPDMLIHTFDQDPHDQNEFTWTEVYRNSSAMIKHINNPPVKLYVLKHEELAEKFEIEVYGNLTQETIETINNLNVPFKHFKTTSVGYFREDIFSNNDHEEKLDRLNDQFSEEVTLENIK